ncbi:hypothetical protein AAHC03_017096 [Spirometra sp. Aus1]
MLFLGKFLHAGTRRVSAEIQTTSSMTSESACVFSNFVEVVTNIGPFSLERLDYEAGKSEIISVNMLNGTNLQYVFDFGDGSPVVKTRTGEVRHTFPAAGIYQLKVSVSSPLEEKQVTFGVRVQQTVLLGVLTAPEGTVNTSASASVEVIQGSGLTYRWFIDARQVDETQTPTWTPKYTKSGLYNVSVLVFNNISSASVWTHQEIYSPVVGLNLDQTSCSIGHCELLFSYTDGDVLSASLRVDGAATGVHLLPRRALKSAVMNLNTVAEHMFELTVNDRHKESKLQGTFTVDEVVTGLDITINPRQGLVNRTLTVTVIVRGGTSYSIDLSDGGDFNRHVPSRALLPLPNPQTFQHTYVEAGSYSICVTVHNVGRQNVECRSYVVAGPMGDYELNLETTRLAIGQPLHLWLARVRSSSTLMLNLMVDWGEEDAQVIYYAYKECTRVHHAYSQRGVHTVTATLSMLTSTAVYTEEVLVGHGIHDFGCTLRRPVVKSWEDNIIEVYMKSLSDVRIALLSPSGVITEKLIKGREFALFEILGIFRCLYFCGKNISNYVVTSLPVSAITLHLCLAHTYTNEPTTR